MSPMTVLTFAVLAMVPVTATGPRRRAGLGSGMTAQKIDGELQEAMSEVLGCGGTREMERFATIERLLQPMWRTMPKNSYGRVEQKSMRYMAHRFFMQQSNYMVKGFDSDTSSTDILSQRVPAFVEKALAGQHDVSHGFALDDCVAMVAMLEQLIFDSESHLLADTYKLLNFGAADRVAHSEMEQILQLYAVEWLMDGNIGVREGERVMKSSAWTNIRQHVTGQIKSFDYTRAKTAPVRRKLDADSYSFDDAHEIVGSIAKTFGSFWEDQCQRAKNHLVSMDRKNTGRIKLSEFYSSSNAGGFHFEESEEYLRDLGVLDETSSWRGKQVIVANYLQGASNCVTTTDHYLLCCKNECESIMEDLEMTMNAPSATPAQIMEFAANVSASSLDDVNHIQLEGPLAKRLQDIADTHKGQVPIHGRLFSQWLHYAFPHECPFPHKSGVASKNGPTQFASWRVSSTSSAAAKAAESEKPSEAVDDWMSQWSHDEEHYADYSRQGTRSTSSPYLGVAVIVGAMAYFGYTQFSSDQQVLGLDGYKVMKSHIV